MRFLAVLGLAVAAEAFAPSLRVETAAPRTTTRKPRDPRDRSEDSAFEYLQDYDARRHAEGFHLLLLGETFDKPRMTVPYAAGALVMVCGMDEPTAVEHSAFAAENGMSCLGNWARETALKLAEQCAARDLTVRVVPGVRGKQAWQGEPANTTPESLPR